MNALEFNVLSFEYTTVIKICKSPSSGDLQFIKELRSFNKERYSYNKTSYNKVNKGHVNNFYLNIRKLLTIYKLVINISDQRIIYFLCK